MSATIMWLGQAGFLLKTENGFQIFRRNRTIAGCERTVNVTEKQKSIVIGHLGCSFR